MTHILFALGDHGTLGAALQQRLQCESGELQWRHFPDGESYLRLLSEVAGKSVLLLCTLNDPDRKLAPLLLLCAHLREMGAVKITLIAPYLSYMRQDARFHPGEAISAKLQGKLLSAHVDALLTLDPHLHRYASMDEVFSVPALALSAMPLLAYYLREHIPDAVLIGPDGESEQWVSACAQLAGGLPYEVLHKKRQGDREVVVTLPDAALLQGRTPVLLDDMISTGHTMLAAMAHLRTLKAAAPVCLCVHGIFSDGAYEKLIAAGARAVLSCNTIPHTSNAMDVAGVLVEALRTAEAARAR